MPAQFYNHLVQEFSKLRPGATFLTIRGYSNNFGEIADVSVCFHVDYMNAVKRSKEIISNYNPTLMDCIGKLYSVEDLIAARQELLKSYDQTLAGTSNPTTKDVYDSILGADGNPINGIKLHKNQELVHLFGYRVHKRIIVEGNYKEVKSAVRTLAKNDLREKTPLNRFAQYKLEPGRFDQIAVQNMTFNEEDLVRQAIPTKK